MTNLRAGRPRNCSSLLGKDKIFCPSPMCPDWHLGFIHPSMHRLRGFVPQVKRPGRNGDQSHPSSAEIKNEWSYTPKLHTKAALYRHSVMRDKFTFTRCCKKILKFIYLNITQLDALNFIMSLFHASTCFEHMCSSSGGQNCTIQRLVSSHL